MKGNNFISGRLDYVKIILRNFIR